MKVHLKLSSGKCGPFCLSLNLLNDMSTHRFTCRQVLFCRLWRFTPNIPKIRSSQFHKPVINIMIADGHWQAWYWSRFHGLFDGSVKVFILKHAPGCLCYSSLVGRGGNTERRLLATGSTRWEHLNSLAPGRFDYSLKLVNFKLISMIDIFSIFCEIVIRSVPQYLTHH